MASSQVASETSGNPNVTMASASASAGTTTRPSAYQPTFTRTRRICWRRRASPAGPSIVWTITTTGSSRPSHVLAMMKGSIDSSMSSVLLTINGMKAIAQPTGKNQARKARMGWCRIQRAMWFMLATIGARRSRHIGPIPDWAGKYSRSTRPLISGRLHRQQRLDIIVEQSHEPLDGRDQQRFGARVAEVEQRPDDDQRVQIPEPGQPIIGDDSARSRSRARRASTSAAW